MGDAAVAALLAAIRDELEATAERPVRTDAGRWLGEAEAVASDAAAAADEGAPDAVLAERVAQVRRLLSEVEDTGDDEADARIAAARDLADRAADRLGA